MFLFRRTDVKLTLLLKLCSPCCSPRSTLFVSAESSPGFGWTTCRFLCLFRDLLLIDVSLNAKKVEPCRVCWPVSPPSCSQSPHWYGCTTVEIQSTVRHVSAGSPLPGPIIDKLILQRALSTSGLESPRSLRYRRLRFDRLVWLLSCCCCMDSVMLVMV